MKKAAVIMMIGISLHLTASAAAAYPLSITGNFGITYERDTSDDQPAVDGATYALKLLFEQDLGSGWLVYLQLGGEYATEPLLADFSTADEAYGPDRKSVVALDQYGLVYRTGQMVYKFGRQDAAVGKTTLLYSRANTYMGKRRFVDGLTSNGTAGKVELAAILAQEDNPGHQNNKLYAVRTGYNLSERLHCGLTWGHYQSSGGIDTNHWAFDGTYNFGKTMLTAEYTKSSSSGLNKAYAVTLTHEFDGRKSMYTTFFRVEQNGDMGGQSGFDNDSQGIYYGLAWELSKTDFLDIVYRDQKLISSGKNNDKFIATISRRF